MKKVYICLPYRDHDWASDGYTRVYAGIHNPGTDGDVLCVTYDETNKPVSYELIRSEDDGPQVFQPLEAGD